MCGNSSVKFLRIVLGLVRDVFRGRADSVRPVSTRLARLCLLTVLVGCSVDLSNLGAPLRKDASTAPDEVFPTGNSGGNADAEAWLGGSPDALASGGSAGAGGSGGAQTGGITGAGGGVGVGGSTATGGSGGARADGAALAADAVGAGGVKGDVGGALDGSTDVAEDSVPTTYDGGGADHAADSIPSGGDDADGATAAPEIGAAVLRDLAADRQETSGQDEGDSGCLNNDCGPHIVPSVPAAMKCNLDGSTAELSWSDLSTWEPTNDPRLCGNAEAYSVQGNVVPFQPGLQVLAEVYAPEDSTWHPISGGPTVRPDPTGSFHGSFCLPKKGLERTFRFRIVQASSSQDVGVTCLIHVS